VFLRKTAIFDFILYIYPPEVPSTVLLEDKQYQAKLPIPILDSFS